VNVNINARHMETTEALREHIESKAAKLPRIYEGVQSVDVTLDIDADMPVVEFVVQGRRKHTFVAKHRDADMYACIDVCISKIAEQLRRHKDRIRDHQGPGHEQTNAL